MLKGIFQRSYFLNAQLFTKKYEKTIKRLKRDHFDVKAAAAY